MKNPGGVYTAMRKVTLVATIVAIALLAAGVGYAYTSSTQNSGNIANSEYVTLVQGGGGGYSFSKNVEVDWNTVDKKVDTNYVTEYSIPGLTPGSPDDHMGNVYIKQIGDPISVLTKGVGMNPYGSLECKVEPASTWIFFTAGDHPTTFFLKVENNNNITWFKLINQNHAQKYGESGWDGGNTFTIAYDGSEHKYYDTTVTVYYAIDGGNSIAVTHELGEQPDGPSSTILGYAMLKFTVTN